MAHNKDEDTIDLSEISKICKNTQPQRPAAQQPSRRRPTSGQISPQQAPSADEDSLWDFDDAQPFDSGIRQRPEPDAQRAHIFDFDFSDPHDPYTDQPQPAPGVPYNSAGEYDGRPAQYSAPQDVYDSGRRPNGSGIDAYGDVPQYITNAPEIPEDERTGTRRKRRKKHRFLRFLLILLGLLILISAAAALFARPPKRETEGLGSRTGDTVNVLIAGTDQDGTRTDTIMLVSISKKSGKISLTSVPRDTLVDNVYTSQKINSVYGFNGTGSDGMEALMAELTEILGITPDGYVLVDLDAFIQLVDLMGGVWFDVPQDMHYEDPTQDLYIDLTAGYQKLDGQHAMQLVRFRSYAMADLQRVNVQRDFIQAALNQWLSVKGVLHAPQVVRLMQENVQTDLSVSNMIWLALAMKSCGTDDMETMTLPGVPGMYDGVSFFILDRQAVVDTVNSVLNPYADAVTADRVVIKTY